MAECVKLFFRWQHPFSLMFNQDVFSRGTKDGKYISPALLHAVCALGALMSPDRHVSELADRFAASAQQELFSQGFHTPQITSSQAYLCCAFYEAGRGNVNKAWMFSGKGWIHKHPIAAKRDRGGFSHGARPRS